MCMEQRRGAVHRAESALLFCDTLFSVASVSVVVFSLLSLRYNVYFFFSQITRPVHVLAKWVRSLLVGGSRPHFTCMVLTYFTCLFRWWHSYLFTEEKANLEINFPGKNGMGLFPDKTPLRKANPQQAVVTPLRPGKREHRKKLLDRMVGPCIRSLRDVGELPRCCIPWFVIGEMG